MSTPIASSPRTGGSLARSTLIKMGVRIAVIIALTTLVSYLHIFHSFRTEALMRVERSVTERSQKDQATFVLAQEDDVLIKPDLIERRPAWQNQDPTPVFDSLFTKQGDVTS